MTVLLMTRTEDQSRGFVRNLPSFVLDKVRLCYSPLIEIVPVSGSIPWGGSRGVIFTSKNGARVSSALDPRRDLPAWCVGFETTKLASSLGWDAHNMGQNGDEFVPAVRSATVEGPLIHLGGKHRRGQIAKKLSSYGIETKEHVVYDQKLRPLTVEAQSLLRSGEPIVAPLFSPRTANQFVTSAVELHNVHLILISEAAADEVRDYDVSSTIVAPKPNALSITKCICKWIEGI